MSVNTSVEPAETLLIIYAVGLILGSNSTLFLPIPMLFTNTSCVCFFQVTGLSSVLTVVIPASIYVFVVTVSDVVIPVTVLGSCWNASSKPISGYLLIVN